jgi:hypothetical protein
MSAPYNVLNTSNTGDLYSLFKFVNNDSTGGLFMPIMLVVIWLISFIGAISEGRQASRAFIFSSFICSILGMILSLIGMLNSQYMYFLFLMVGAGLIWYKLDNAPGI